MTTKAIAALEAIGVQTVRADLNESGLQLGRGGAHRLHPSPAPRRCALGETCLHSADGLGREFTPATWNVQRGFGNYCSRECGYAAHRTLATPAPRVCERSGCAVVFTPERFQASRGLGVYCSRDCRARALSEANAARYRCFEEAISCEDKLTSSEAAALLGISMGSLSNLVSAGEIEVERVSFDGATFRAFTTSAIEAYEKRRARELTSWGRAWLEPESALARLRGLGTVRRLAKVTGLREVEAEAVYRARIDARRRRILSKRRGRRRESVPQEHYVEWARRFHELRNELSEQHERDVLLGLEVERLSDWHVCLAVAEEDWQRRPERWDRSRWPHAKGDPDSLAPEHARDAARRVLKGLHRAKALQSAVPEIPSL